jgi:hypothetical protein
MIARIVLSIIFIAAIAGLAYSIYKSSSIDANGQKRPLVDTLKHIFTLSFILDNDSDNPIDVVTDTSADPGSNQVLSPSTTPASSTPASSTPASSTPSGSTPSGSTPSGSTPSGSTPASSTPASSTPASSTPSGSTLPTDASTVDKLKYNITNYTSKPRKEVFNIDNSIFTYDQAPTVCKAFNANLATPAQMETAFKKGANWCNAGWAEGQHILHPVQKSYYNSLSEKKRVQCAPDGKPGVIGGKFSDPSVKFGVNCYGLRPAPKKGLIFYDTKKSKTKCKVNSGDDGMDDGPDEMSTLKKLIKNGKIIPRPYSSSKWSSYSHKKSSYVLSNNTDANKEILAALNELQKDPRTLSNPNTPSAPQNDSGLTDLINGKGNVV